MPFDLTNAPGVFQRLMQRILVGLNPLDGPEFVSVYLDDILVYSRFLEDHLQHLQVVLEKLTEAGLKLKPAKCHFARSELEYLGHVITCHGLRTNPRLIQAVREFPTPKNVHEVCQFLGLASYYRRFICNFAMLPNPLHYLDVQWLWTTECDSAFQKLKELLTTAPVLAYPKFSKEYVLETDASTHGLGAVLSQEQLDKNLHLVTYVSRALSSTERNYGITELETLAVVWAMSHFHYFLYRNRVTVYIDHTSVKAVLESPNPTAKHARWWTRVYGKGVKEVKLCYRAGRENKGADALSHSPQLPAPVVGMVDGEVQVSTIVSADETNSDCHRPDSSTALPATSLNGDATSGPVAGGDYVVEQTALVGTINQTVGEQQTKKDSVTVGGDQSPVGPGMSAALASENCWKMETTAEVRSIKREPVSSHQATCQLIAGERSSSKGNQRVSEPWSAASGSDQSTETSATSISGLSH